MALSKHQLQNPTGKPTISFLCTEYGKHADGYYRENGEPTPEWHSARQALKQLPSLYGSQLACQFDAIAFQGIEVILNQGRSGALDNQSLHGSYPQVVSTRCRQGDGKKRVLLERDMPNLIEGRRIHRDRRRRQSSPSS